MDPARSGDTGDSYRLPAPSSDGDGPHAGGPRQEARLVDDPRDPAELTAAVPGRHVRAPAHHKFGVADYEDLILLDSQTVHVSDRDVLSMLASQGQAYFPPGVPVSVQQFRG